MIPEDVQGVFLRVIQAIEEAGVDYAVMGGYAVLAWGVPRATFDIDVLVDDEGVEFSQLLEAFQGHGFGIPEAYRRGWRDRIRDMSLVKIDLHTDGRTVAVDLFPVTTPLQRAALERCRRTPVPGRRGEIPIISAADLLLFKLLADRAKDRADIQNVLAVQGIPDEAHVREWARRLGVEERLQSALLDAGLVDS